MALTKEEIESKLINNDSLFNSIHVIQQNFDIIPDDKPHIGASIAYQDLQELRDNFVNDLFDTITDWVYSSEKYSELLKAEIKQGKSSAAASSAVQRKARDKFRKKDNSDKLLIQGQLGELMLFHFIQRYMKAIPLLRKMKITTSNRIERFGADAIHYKKENNDNIIILGEAKTYTSKYKFDDAFSESISSILILLKLISKIAVNPCDIIYIIPTLSLLTQVTEDFNKMLKLLEIEDYAISNSYTEYNNQEQSHIYIMTQEKANSSLSSNRNAFKNRLILVADEIQNIERILSHEDERAKILFDTLNEFRYKENVEQIIISGPRIQQIEKVGKSIFGIETDDVITDVSPVLNLTYSIKQFEGQYYFKQYCMLTDSAICEQIANNKLIVGYGKNIYDDDYLKYLNRIISCFGESQNIVFAPTPDVARNIACNIVCCKSNPQTQDLISYYQNTVRENYSMCESLSHGVAYHHGKLPMHVRCTLEKAISERLIGTVACTTTLMQGVNMPAQNIIIRNPHLYLYRKRNTAELSNYEMANLRGRAGRLLMDFIGRTFVMDESSFEETDGYDQLNLFDDVEKELPANYGQKFEDNKTQILNVLDSDSAVDTTMKQYGFLISHIRQSVVKFGYEAKSRLQNVGISLTKEQLAAIILRMNKLSVPKEICAKNRYWDPVVLDDIYLHYSELVPSHPNEYGAKAKLDRMLKYLRDNETTSYMYNKHIPWSLRRSSGRGLLVNLCMKWSKEFCLTEILKDKKYDNPDEIDSVIEILQNTVSFHVPLLLKPIFDIKNPDSSFLTCMQSGAVNNVTKKLISLGIPRETAIYLFDNLFSELKATEYDEIQLENHLRNQLRTNIDSLPYWVKIQFEYLI